MKSEPMLDAALSHSAVSDPIEMKGQLHSSPAAVRTLPIPAVDEGLLEAVRTGNLRDAVSLAHRQHGLAIGRFAMAMTGSQADAEEIVQETLIAAYAAFPQYRGEGSVRAFLFTIARRKVAHLRETQTRRAAATSSENIADPNALGEVDAAAKERAARVRKALDQLRPSEREAVLIRYGSECSFREVAEACGCEEATARQRVSRAVKHLRELLSEEGTP